MAAGVDLSAVHDPDLRRVCSAKGCPNWYHHSWDDFGEPPSGWLRGVAGLPVRVCPAHAAPAWGGHWPVRRLEDQEPRGARPPVALVRMSCECGIDVGVYSTLMEAGEGMVEHLAEVA